MDKTPTPEGLVAVEQKISFFRKLRYAWDDRWYFTRAWLRRKLLDAAFALHKDSNLVRHAIAEMKAAGLYDEDSDYGGMIPEAVMDLVYVHSMQGHSGFSHKTVLNVFNKVIDFKTLTPLTDNPDEWQECSLAYGGKKACWQNRRQGSCFSTDGGKTYYDIDDKEYVKFDLLKDPETGEEYKSYYSSLPPEEERKRYPTVPHKKVSENASAAE